MIVFWIIAGVLVLALFALAYRGTDRYRDREVSNSAMQARSSGIRNSIGGPGPF
jgi:hypothetical protein